MNTDTVALKPSEFTETLLATVISKYFKIRSWDLYPEVVFKWFSGRPDYVGIKDSLVMVIECKKTLSYEVIEQLYRWRELAEFFDATEKKQKQMSDIDAKRTVLHGVPHLLVAASFVTNKSAPISDLKKKLLRDARIGHVTVRYEGPASNLYLSVKEQKQEEHDGVIIRYQCVDQMRLQIDGHLWSIREEMQPMIQPGSRRTAAKLAEQLSPDMKRAIAGASGKVGGNYSTPFRRTLMKAIAVLEEYGESHIAEIIEKINTKHGGHHYCSDSVARAGISKFLREFNLAVTVNRLPVFVLVDGYKDRLYSSETVTQKAIKERQKERKEAEERRKEARRNSSEPYFWEKM